MHKKNIIGLLVRIWMHILYDIIEVCNSSSRHKQKEINKILINYFLDNDCEKLDSMVDIWASNSLFDGRIKIIKDCINIIKTNEKNINYSNFIVPILITQIDGIQNEFMKINGLSVRRRGIYDASGEKLKDENGNTLYKKDYFRNLTSNNGYFGLMNDIFFRCVISRYKVWI